jgi:hypothetical protein
VLKKKLSNVGFVDVAIPDRAPFGLAALARYPLFPPEFLEFVRAAVPADRHDALVSAIVVTARKPFAHEAGGS